MKKPITSPAVGPSALVAEAVDEVRASFERLCLTAGLATLTGMMEEDAARLCGPRHGRGGDRAGHRWGKTKGKIGFHGGKVEIERPRVRARDGAEVTLPSWAAAMNENLLGQWALNLMLMNVSTRKFGRAVRLPGGDIPAEPGAGVAKSAVSRRFVALSAGKMQAWMSADLSGLDLLVIQIDGIHIDQDLILLVSIGIDGNGDKHPLGVMEGASENAAVCQALIDNLVGRGLGPAHRNRPRRTFVRESPSRWSPPASPADASCRRSDRAAPGKGLSARCLCAPSAAWRILKPHRSRQ
jgi:transposase-like protein